jgi:hypothetical protein
MWESRDRDEQGTGADAVEGKTIRLERAKGVRAHDTEHGRQVVETRRRETAGPPKVRHAPLGTSWLSASIRFQYDFETAFG